MAALLDQLPFGKAGGITASGPLLAPSAAVDDGRAGKGSCADDSDLYDNVWTKLDNFMQLDNFIGQNWTTSSKKVDNFIKFTKSDWTKL